jgi:valyl-tRNA synthetase
MSYEYSRARKLIDDFFWNVFTDNYLEIVKKRVYQGNGAARKSAQYSLYVGLLKILKMYASIIPFITEEIYLNHYKKFEEIESIHISKWPDFQPAWEDDLLENEWKILIEIVSRVRQEKSNSKKSMNSPIKLILEKREYFFVKPLIKDLENVTGAVSVEEGNEFKVEFVED